MLAQKPGMVAKVERMSRRKGKGLGMSPTHGAIIKISLRGNHG